MTDSAKKPGSDDATFGVLLLFAVVGPLTATSISVIITVALLVVAWFFGNLKRTAFFAIGIAVVLGSFQLFLPRFVEFVIACFLTYRNAFEQEHYLLAVAIEWLRFASNPQAWLRLLPLGLFVGAAWLLAIDSRKNSAIKKVFGDTDAPQPSPWARIKIQRVLTGPLIHDGKIVLGADAITGKRVALSRYDLSQHIVIGGRSGRGKSVTLGTLCSGAAQLGIPIFYMDGKGDPQVQEDLRQIAAANNRPFYAFDTTNPNASCAWDVLADMNATTQADVLVSLRRFSEDHFEAKAGKFALLTCKVLRHVGVEVDLFNFTHSLSVDRLLARLRRNTSKDDHEGRALMKDVVALRTIETEAVDSLMSALGRLIDSDFGFLFDIARATRDGRPILRLLQARRECAVVCVSLPPLDYEKMAPKVAAVGISALKAILPALDRRNQAEAKKPLPLAAKQLLAVFDEWSVFAGDHVLNVVNQGRSYGGSCCLAAQSYADFLVEGHDKLLRQVVGSAATFVVHELNDVEDAQYAAGLFATQDAVVHTAQTIGGVPTEVSSARRAKEFSVHPDDIKNIGVGEAYIMNKNQKNKKTKKSVIQLVKVRKITN